MYEGHPEWSCPVCQSPKGCEFCTVKVGDPVVIDCGFCDGNGYRAIYSHVMGGRCLHCVKGYATVKAGSARHKKWIARCDREFGTPAT